MTCASAHFFSPQCTYDCQVSQLASLQFDNAARLATRRIPLKREFHSSSEQSSIGGKQNSFLEENAAFPLQATHQSPTMALNRRPFPPSIVQTECERRGILPYILYLCLPFAEREVRQAHGRPPHGAGIYKPIPSFRLFSFSHLSHFSPLLLPSRKICPSLPRVHCTF